MTTKTIEQLIAEIQNSTMDDVEKLTALYGLYTNDTTMDELMTLSVAVEIVERAVGMDVAHDLIVSMDIPVQHKLARLYCLQINGADVNESIETLTLKHSGNKLIKLNLINWKKVGLTAGTVALAAVGVCTYLRFKK